ncbi:MAG: FAD-dependent oxidoreductase [Chloroflexi bacterium]|uniref:FAD-dependent oxidoreductase n=1 Tax=Candidatus Flexifilum breve TaxID=3140694 RepID=UPI0031364259|nr:FAD-dependent oxidoreductase [Chloroflexota bacterium]
MTELRTDILIVGGGLGGVAAALAALRLGQRVVLTDENRWLGGQMTAQGVPPDEHMWIESEGCTNSYRSMRERVRAYYREHYPLTPAARADRALNPGQGQVSGLCHEPIVGDAVLRNMLQPYLSNQQLILLQAYFPVTVETAGDRVRAVTLRSGERTVSIQASYVLDATELGDLLELGGVEHVIGAESQQQTGELHALVDAPDPRSQQGFSWCYALSYHPEADHRIAKPAMYEFWRGYRAAFWPAQHLRWVYAEPTTLEPVVRPIFTAPPTSVDGDDLWHFRRLLYAGHFAKDYLDSDITLVNWVQMEYWLKPLVGVTESERSVALYEAQQLSLSFLYWMQTEAPRPAGGYGYPGLRLRGDVFGNTPHGLAQAPYIRESRRIQAEFTILEQHVGYEARSGLLGAENFPDSVGVGSYRIDLHPTYRRNYVDISTWPFQIPLGALIPIRVENLLPACKNIGTTHITNGCYRLHPVEWNIGEAAGALAAYCLLQNTQPRQVLHSSDHLASFQSLLVSQLGFQLQWSEAVRLTPRHKLNPLGI